MKLIQILAATLLVMLGALSVEAQLPTKQVLTLEAAKKIAAAAEAEAKKRGATVVIAVVDDGGYLLVLERLDDLQGGVPIIFDGKVIGAFGVSGNSPQEDEDIAKAGADYVAAAIKGGNK